MRTPNILPDKDYKLINLQNKTEVIFSKPSGYLYPHNPVSSWVNLANEITINRLHSINLKPSLIDDEDNYNKITEHGTRYLSNYNYVLDDKISNEDKSTKYKNNVVSNYSLPDNVIFKFDYNDFRLIYLDAFWNNSSLSYNQYYSEYNINNLNAYNIIYDKGLSPIDIFKSSKAFVRKNSEDAEERIINNYNNYDYLMNNTIRNEEELYFPNMRRIYWDGSIRGDDDTFTLIKYYHHLTKSTHLDKGNYGIYDKYPANFIYHGEGGLTPNLKIRCFSHLYHPFVYLKGIVEFKNNEVTLHPDNETKIGNVTYDFKYNNKIINDKYIPYKNISNLPADQLETINFIKNRNNSAGSTITGNVLFNNHANKVSDLLLNNDDYYHGNLVKKKYSRTTLPRYGYVSLFGGDINRQNTKKPYFGLLNWEDLDNDEIISLQDNVGIDDISSLTISFNPPKNAPERIHLFNIGTSNTLPIYYLGDNSYQNRSLEYPITAGHYEHININNIFTDNYLNYLNRTTDGYYPANTESIGMKAKIANLPMNHLDEYNLYYFRMKERPFFTLNNNSKDMSGIVDSVNIYKKYKIDHKYFSRFILKALDLSITNPDNNGPVEVIQYNNITIEMYPGDTVYPESIYPNCLRADREVKPDNYSNNLIPTVRRKPEHHKRLGYLDHYYYCIKKDRNKTRKWLPDNVEFIPLIPINDGKLIDGNRTEGEVLAFRNEQYYLLPEGTRLINGGYPISDDRGNHTFYALENPDEVLIEDNRVKNIYKTSNIYKRLARYHFPLRREIGDNPIVYITHDNKLSRMELVIDKSTMLITRHELDDVFDFPVNGLIWEKDHYPFQEVIGPNGKEHDKVKIVNGFYIAGFLGATYIPTLPDGIIVDFPIKLEEYIRTHFINNYTPSDSVEDIFNKLISPENKLTHNPRDGYKKVGFFKDNKLSRFNGKLCVANDGRKERYYRYLDNIF